LAIAFLRAADSCFALAFPRFFRPAFPRQPQQDFLPVSDSSLSPLGQIDDHFCELIKIARAFRLLHAAMMSRAYQNGQGLLCWISVVQKQSFTVDIPISTRRPMNIPVGGNAERFVKGTGMNNRFATAPCQVRHRTAAFSAEGSGKASSLGQVEAHDRLFSSKPSQRRGFHNHLARMRRAGRFSAT
jgi:hypothetical protein